MAYGAILGQQPDKKLNQSILLDESSGILSNVQGDDITNEVLAVLDAVPTSRTINGKALSSNINLTATDVNAAPKYTYGTSDLTAGSSTLATGTLYFVYE